MFLLILVNLPIRRFSVHRLRISVSRLWIFVFRIMLQGDLLGKLIAIVINIFFLFPYLIFFCFKFLILVRWLPTSVLFVFLCCILKGGHGIIWESSVTYKWDLSGVSDIFVQWTFIKANECVLDASCSIGVQ